MKLSIQGQVYTYDRPQVLLDVAVELKKDRVLAATVNGRLRELSYRVHSVDDYAWFHTC